MFYFKNLFAITLTIFFLSGCAQKVVQKPDISQADFQKVTWDDIEGFEYDNLNHALEVFQKDCKVSRKFENLLEVCKEADLTQDGKSFFTSNFTPYKLMADGDDTGLITGYYEPILNGSLKKTRKFKYAVYATPKDLITIDLSDAYPELKDYKLRGKLIGNMVIPYDTRETIEQNKDDNELLTPICFVDDRIDLFFMHIQGSGKIQLQDGTMLNVGYAQQNGRAYYAIGKKLIEMGVIDKEDVSLQSIRAWLKKNPGKIDTILNLNESYIFFKESQKDATGSLGTQLTENRNLAVDREFIPLGFPVFISTTNPINKKPINQLMVAADTGGAIKGKIRADFFFGNGERAEMLAGKMKQQGKLYMLIPKDIEKETK
jgi:membrane-bound lytic murein transglycosylase A